MVKDTGMGIEESELERVFEPFGQQKNQDHNFYGGTGLGLAICDKLVKLMGGEIKLASLWGEGSSFEVILPHLAWQENLPKETWEDNPREALAPLTNAKLLLVDDVSLNRQLIQAYINNLSLDVIEAVNGQEAIDLARQEKPDLIMMDIKMPVMDGIEASRKIKAMEEMKDIPIIALTASTMNYEKQNILDVCDDFLSKPVNKREVLSLLHRYLGTKKSD